MYKLICGTIFVFLFTQNSSVEAATKCYSCSTSLHPGCGNPFEGAGYQQCATSATQEFNCLKYSHVVANTTIIFRGCKSASDTCDTIEAALIAEGTKMVACNLCSDDMCNSANFVQLSLIPTIFLVIFVFF